MAVPYYTYDATTGKYNPVSGNTTNYYSGTTLPSYPTAPATNISAPGKTTIKYPGTESGKLWLSTTRGDIAAAGESEKRALANQQSQVGAAQEARRKAFESSGYTDFVSQRQNLQPTYSQNVMDTLLGQQRDIISGQTGAQKRGIVEAGGGTMPSGFRRQSLQAADVAGEGLYARSAADLGRVKAEQDRKDEIESIGLAYQQAVYDYGVESDLAKALERIYATTIAKTPEYDWGELQGIVDRMAQQQEYTVETEGGGGGGGGGGEGGGGGGGSIGGGHWETINYPTNKNDPNYQGNSQTRKYRGLPEQRWVPD